MRTDFLEVLQFVLGEGEQQCTIFEQLSV